MPPSLLPIFQKALRYRSEQGLQGGVVLFYEGKVYGWKNALRDPNHEKPGALAVDEEGMVFIAEGGDEYSGASAWALHPQHMH